MPGSLTRSTLAISAGLWLAAGGVALSVAALGARSVRQRLDFRFGELPSEPGTALSTFGHNAVLLVGALAATAVAQVMSRWRPRRLPLVLARDVARSALDTIVGLETALNVAIVGAAVGAYGSRMVLATLPHGPLELLAFAGALALYGRARNGLLGWSDVVRTGTPLFAALAVAALLETYIALVIGLRLLALVVATFALAVSALSARRLLHSFPSENPPVGSSVVTATPTRRAPNEHQSRRRSATPAPRPLPIRGAAATRSSFDPRVLGLNVYVLIALEAAGGALSLAGLIVTLGVRRARHRARRVYGHYTLQLSGHDEAKPQDLEDMMEAIANLVRVFPAERARHGQSLIAFELRHSAGRSGALEWSIVVRCEARIVVALDGTLSAAYPDVRLIPVAPSDDGGRVPGHVMRFRKRRSFIYPLVASHDDPASPPLEAIAHAQTALDVPSVVRFGLTPAPVSWETIAHRLYRRHENRLARQERWGLPESGLRSTLHRAEMSNAEHAQNRSLFWLELAIAARDGETCRQLAAAVQARRGENRLHRRWIYVRRNLYRRRFESAAPPLIPSPRALISAAEAAHLLALPTARMKGVPVRRIAIPRIPMPPEILRARADTEVPVPSVPDVRHDATTLVTEP